jgi:3-oxoacyl-[acyl-carrier protein] reductase
MSSTAAAHRGRVALVTGGGSYIGSAIAARLAAEGAKVAVTGRRTAPLAATVQRITAAGGTAMAVSADVTVAAEMTAAAATVAAAFGPVDLLAAIAGGHGDSEPIDRVDPAQWVHVVQINLIGTFHSIRAVLPGMRQAGRGAIITCCGGGAWFPMLGETMTAYASAKAGICRLTDQLAVELWDSGIRVNCLQPGQVWSSERLQAATAEAARTGVAPKGLADNHPPEHAAELAAFLLSDASAPLTGRVVSVDETWWRDRAKVLAVAASLHAACLRRIAP